MAQLLIVTVTDKSGNVLLTKQIDTGLQGSNAIREGLTDAEAALYLAHPEVCPWDCDSCRE